MTFYRHGRAMCWSLAASLAIHGIALGGLLLSAGPGSPDRPSGAGGRGAAASGGPVLVRLLETSASPGRAAGRADVAAPQARTRRVPPTTGRTVELPNRAEPPPPTRPATIARAASDARPAPRVPDSAAPPRRTEAPTEVASALDPPEPPTGPAASAGGPAPQPAPGMPSGASGPDGALLASVDLGAGDGSEAGPLDRVARPAAPIRPHYPPRARQRGEEADVTLDVWVGARGDVDRVAVSRSAGAEFDAAALEAVRKARFHPALRDGRPVPSRAALRLHFRLE